jgi:hypothetical protein
MEKGEADSEKEKEEKQLAKGHMLALAPLGRSDHSIEHHQEPGTDGINGIEWGACGTNSQK